MAQKAEQGGGAQRRRPGALPPRERLERLFDPGTFKELGRFAVHECRDFGMEQKRFLGDGVVTGFGRVGGREVFAHASDWTVIRGTWGRRHCEKMVEVYRLAGRVGAPVVALLESAGARLQEGFHAMEEGARVGASILELSGVVPQLTGILGTCIGLGAVCATAADFVCMLRGRSSLCFAGPEVIRQATGEEVDEQTLGGSDVHLRVTGHAVAGFDTEDELIAFLRELLSFLPQNNAEVPPLLPTEDPPGRPVPEIQDVLPRSDNEAFDIRDLIRIVVDDRHFLEIQAEFARNGVCGFARFGGRPVGVLANQPLHLSGALDVDVARKFSRFVNTLDCYHLPLVSFIDVPGVLPGLRETHRGSLGWAVQLSGALMGLRSPKVTVLVRRCFGGAWVMANSKGTGGDLLFAYPGAVLGPMSPEALGRVVFKADPPPEVLEQIRRTQTDPLVAAGLGHIDDVIRPEDTRAEICRALEMLESKRVLGRNPRRHMNLPL
jgi:propionyl-CoA carboxylase beta chain